MVYLFRRGRRNPGSRAPARIRIGSSNFRRREGDEFLFRSDIVPVPVHRRDKLRDLLALFRRMPPFDERRARKRFAFGSAAAAGVAAIAFLHPSIQETGARNRTVFIFVQQPHDRIDLDVNRRDCRAFRAARRRPGRD
jgi:hypothetical protein